MSHLNPTRLILVPQGMDTLMNMLDVAIQNWKRLLRSAKIHNSEIAEKSGHFERRFSDFPPNLRVNVSLLYYLPGLEQDCYKMLVKTGQCFTNPIALALNMFFKVPYFLGNEKNFLVVVKIASSMPRFDHITSSILPCHAADMS
jgi:hypothetical protein